MLRCSYSCLDLISILSSFCMFNCFSLPIFLILLSLFSVWVSSFFPLSLWPFEEKHILWAPMTPCVVSYLYFYCLRCTFWMVIQAVGDAFNAGFYEEQVRLRSLPLLESRPKRFMRNMSAKDAISSKKVKTFC